MDNNNSAALDPGDVDDSASSSASVHGRRSMIERAAMAMQEADAPGLPWHLETEDDQATYRRLARAAIAALAGPDEHGRWPGTIEMMDAMVAAFDKNCGPHGMRETLMAVWNAGVRAAASAVNNPDTGRSGADTVSQHPKDAPNLREEG